MPKEAKNHGKDSTKKQKPHIPPREGTRSHRPISKPNPEQNPKKKE